MANFTLDSLHATQHSLIHEIVPVPDYPSSPLFKDADNAIFVIEHKFSSFFVMLFRWHLLSDSSGHEINCRFQWVSPFIYLDITTISGFSSFRSVRDTTSVLRSDLWNNKCHRKREEDREKQNDCGRCTVEHQGTVSSFLWNRYYTNDSSFPL